MPRKLELSGMRFGRWTVVSESESRARHGKVKWNCVCDCGNASVVVGESLKSGHSSSCGCLHSDKLKARNTTHGDTGGLHYSRWNGIKNRTGNPNHAAYKDYGGRGIGMYGPWLHDYVSFRNWINENLGPCPSGHSLDRIDNDGNYEPNNLRWADRSQQSLNKRKKG